MTSTPTATNRMIAARPPIVDSLDQLVGADERALLLDQILASPVPDGRGRRPRRIVMVAFTTAAAAAAMAAAFAARAWPGGSSADSQQPVSPVLASRVFLAVRSANDVVVVDSTNDGVRSTFWALTEGGGATRMRYSINGTPKYDQTISHVNGRTTLTNVDFAARAWWTEVLVSVPGNPCEVTAVRQGSPAPKATATGAPRRAVQRRGGGACQVFGPTPRQVVEGLNAGIFHVTGHPKLHGRPTIELTAQYPGVGGKYELFIDARSYLPVMSVNSTNSAPFTTTYRYLPASPANLTLLQVPIPAGFRHAAQPIRCDVSELGPHGSPDGCP